MKKVELNEDKTNFETPTKLYNDLDNEFHFYCDLAASSENAKCSYYLDEDSDSLSKPWHILLGGYWGFINPPWGGKSQLEKWIKKCDEEAQLGAKIVCLMPTKDETKYYHHHIKGRYEKRELLGRLVFEIGGKPYRNKEGKVEGARFSNCIIIFKKGSYKEWLFREMDKLITNE